MKKRTQTRLAICLVIFTALTIGMVAFRRKSSTSLFNAIALARANGHDLDHAKMQSLPSCLSESFSQASKPDRERADFLMTLVDLRGEAGVASHKFKVKGIWFYGFRPSKDGYLHSTWTRAWNQLDWDIYLFMNVFSSGCAPYIPYPNDTDRKELLVQDGNLAPEEVIRSQEPGHYSQNRAYLQVYQHLVRKWPNDPCIYIAKVAMAHLSRRDIKYLWLAIGHGLPKIERPFVLWMAEDLRTDYKSATMKAKCTDIITLLQKQIPRGLWMPAKNSDQYALDAPLDRLLRAPINRSPKK